MTFSHSQINAYPAISLHDHRATHLDAAENRLAFTFDGGFTLTPQISPDLQNSCKNSGRAALVFHDAEAEFYIHREHRIFGISFLITRKNYSLKKLAEKLCSGSWELEFIGEYHGYNSVFYTCCIWQKHKPYHIDCQLDIYCENIEYLWNDTI